jgi:hypothetical protein
MRPYADVDRIDALVNIGRMLHETPGLRTIENLREIFAISQAPLDDDGRVPLDAQYLQSVKVQAEIVFDNTLRANTPLAMEIAKDSSLSEDMRASAVKNYIRGVSGDIVESYVTGANNAEHLRTAIGHAAQVLYLWDQTTPADKKLRKTILDSSVIFTHNPKVLELPDFNAAFKKLAATYPDWLKRFVAILGSPKIINTEQNIGFVSSIFLDFNASDEMRAVALQGYAGLIDWHESLREDGYVSNIRVAMSPAHIEFEKKNRRDGVQFQIIRNNMRSRDEAALPLTPKPEITDIAARCLLDLIKKQDGIRYTPSSADKKGAVYVNASAIEAYIWHSISPHAAKVAHEYLELFCEDRGLQRLPHHFVAAKALEAQLSVRNTGTLMGEGANQAAIRRDTRRLLADLHIHSKPLPPGQKLA